MDRPGFESYSIMNMYPSYMMPMNTFPSNMGSCQNNTSNLQSLENEINNLKNRVSRLENSMYPEAIDYTKTYQSSLNMM